MSVPANSSNDQRFLTLDAFRRAGFEVLALLNEPSAAGFEYAHRFRNTVTSKREYVLVYDLGGGTFDCSLIHMAGQVNEVITSAGESAPRRRRLRRGDPRARPSRAPGRSAPPLSDQARAQLLEECRRPEGSRSGPTPAASCSTIEALGKEPLVLPGGRGVRRLHAGRGADAGRAGRGHARSAARAGRGGLERAGRPLRGGRGEQLPARLPPPPRALRPGPRAPLAASLRRHRHRARQLPRRGGGLRAVRRADPALRGVARGRPRARGRLRPDLRQGHAPAARWTSRRWKRCGVIGPPTTSATTGSWSAASCARAGRTATSRPGTRSASRSIPRCAAAATWPRSRCERLDGPGPEIEERYHCTAAGTFEVTLAVLDDGFSRTFRIARPVAVATEAERGLVPLPRARPRAGRRLPLLRPAGGGGARACRASRATCPTDRSRSWRRATIPCCSSSRNGCARGRRSRRSPAVERVEVAAARRPGLPHPLDSGPSHEPSSRAAPSR